MDKLDIVSKKIMIKVDKDVSKKLAKDWEDLKKQIEKLKSFNTNGVVPMVRINNDLQTFMREDIPSDVLSKDLILKNAPDKNQDYIIASKKVKDD